MICGIVCLYTCFVVANSFHMSISLYYSAIKSMPHHSYLVYATSCPLTFLKSCFVPIEIRHIYLLWSRDVGRHNCRIYRIYIEYRIYIVYIVYLIIRPLSQEKVPPRGKQVWSFFLCVFTSHVYRTHSCSEQAGPDGGWGLTLHLYITGCL